MKKTATLIILLFIGFTSFGQGSSFTKLIEADSADKAVSFFQNSAGDYFLLSNTTSFGSGKSDIQVTKTDGLGNVSWSYTYGTSDDDVALEMIPANDGGILIVGYSDGFSSTTGEDAITLKLTNSGTISWIRSVRGILSDRANGIYQASTGEIYVVGYNDLDSLGYNTSLTKFSSTGSLFFNKSYGDLGDDIGNAITAGRNGNFLIVGSTDNDSVNIGSAGDLDVQLIEVNSAGTVINSRNVGTIADDFGVDVVSTTDYKYIILGNTEGGVGGGSDILYFEVDTNLTVSRSYWYGGPFNENATNLRQTIAGDVLITGGKDGATSMNDIFALRTNRNGVILNEGILSGMGGDGISQVASVESGSGNYSVFGSGTSFTSNNSENLYLIDLNDQFLSICIDNIDPMQNDAIALSTGTSDTSFNFGQSFIVSFTRTSATPSDSALCCQLEANVSADSIEICDGSGINLGGSSITGYTYAWTEIGSSWTSSSANPSVSPSSTTTYKLVVSSGDCTSDSALVYVKVNATQNVIPLSDTFFCAGDSIMLSAAAGFNSYNWDINGSMFSSSSIFVNSQNTVYLELIDNNSCTYYDTIMVEQKGIPTFSLGSDTTICDNTPITLVGPAGMSAYEWNGILTGANTLTTATQQTHSLTVTTAFGCQYTDQLQLLINPSSPLDIGNDTSICEATTFSIFAPGALTGFLWNDVSSTGSSYDATQGGTYWVEAINSLGCYSYDTITLTEVPGPIFSLGNDTTICGAVNLPLSGPGGAASYLWFNGNTNQTETATGAGLYYLTVTGNNTCVFTDSITISTAPEISISLGNDTTICWTQPLELSPGTGYINYDWSTGQSSVSISVTLEGQYSVTVENAQGCFASDTINVDTMLCPGSVQYLDKIEYSIYPNPSTDKISISTTANLAGYRVEIYNAKGEQCSKLELLDNSQVLDVSNLPSGMYFLKLLSDNKSIGFKVSIHR